MCPPRRALQCGDYHRVYLAGAPLPVHLTAQCKLFSTPSSFSAPALVELDLSRTAISDFDVAAFLQRLSPDRLHTLRLQGCKNLTHAFAFPPAPAPHALSALRVADLSNSHVHDTFVTALMAVAPAVTVLRLNNCQYLATPTFSSPVLTELGAHGCSRLRHPRFVGCTALRTVDLSRSKICNDAIVALYRDNGVPGMATLSLAECFELSVQEVPIALSAEDGVASLGVVPMTGSAITCLDVGNTRLGADFVSFMLRRCASTLTSLTLSDSSTRGADLQSSLVLPALTRLDAGWVEVAPDVAGALLRRCPAIQWVKLGAYTPLASPTLTYVTSSGTVGVQYAQLAASVSVPRCTCSVVSQLGYGPWRDYRRCHGRHAGCVSQAGVPAFG